MAGAGFEVEASASGRQGPARSPDEADAAHAEGLAFIEAKHQRLDELRAQFESEGYSPERAKTMAAMAYTQEA